MLDHPVYGKCTATWLCAGYGSDFELKKLLEHSREGIDKIYGDMQTNALHQALMNEKPECKTANTKLLLEYGADPNIFCFKGLTVLCVVISFFLNGE